MAFCGDFHRKQLNIIIQKRLAFSDGWSGTTTKPGPKRPLESLPRRLFVAEVGLRWCSARCINLTEDSDAKICQEALF